MWFTVNCHFSFKIFFKLPLYWLPSNRERAQETGQAQDAHCPKGWIWKKNGKAQQSCSDVCSVFPTEPHGLPAAFFLSFYRLPSCLQCTGTLQPFLRSINSAFQERKSSWVRWLWILPESSEKSVIWDLSFTLEVSQLWVYCFIVQYFPHIVNNFNFATWLIVDITSALLHRRELKFRGLDGQDFQKVSQSRWFKTTKLAAQFWGLKLCNQTVSRVDFF